MEQESIVQEKRHPRLFRVVLAATPALFALAQAVAEAQLIPAPSGGAAPTIVLSADHGVPGAAITVSGAVPGGVTTSAVRVQWLLSSATEPATEVVVDGGGGYSASLTVPRDVTAGPAACSRRHARASATPGRCRARATRAATPL
jgi:hypothetical protein